MNYLDIKLNLEQNVLGELSWANSPGLNYLDIVWNMTVFVGENCNVKNWDASSFPRSWIHLWHRLNVLGSILLNLCREDFKISCTELHVLFLSFLILGKVAPIIDPLAPTPSSLEDIQ
jgi:hypothetical protein